VVEELQGVVRELQAKAAGHFDLSSVVERLGDLESALGRLQHAIGRLEAGGVRGGAAWTVNRCWMDLGRALIPVNYTSSGLFDQDLAVPTHPLPGLHAMSELAALDPTGNPRQFLLTRLVRERNRAVHGVSTAIRAVEAAQAALGGC
jgi:hypothetical protein